VRSSRSMEIRGRGYTYECVIVAIRYVLPGAIVLVGLVLAIVGGSEVLVGLGVALTGVGVLVMLLNLLMRLGIESSRDREREEEARRFFDRHGRWP
jgi:hypothetical protein